MMRTKGAATRGGNSVGMDIYLNQIRGDQLLTAEEERELAAAIARGDTEARRRLIQANLRLVVTIARKYQGLGLDLDDLVGEGNLGLIRAAEDFDPAFGTRFCTYACHWIKQAVRSALANQAATIRVPIYMLRLILKWRRAERMLRRELGEAPTGARIAAELGLSEAQRLRVERTLRLVRSHTVHEGVTDDPSASVDGLLDPTASPTARIEAEEEHQALRRRLSELPDRERAVLTLRFGLDDQAPQTLTETGRRVGVTREWVRQIEVRAMAKLNDCPEGERPRGRRPAATARATAQAPRNPRFGSSPTQSTECRRPMLQTA